MESIFTIGYEKADPANFLATLVANDINLLLDVRERAMSRRKGFAKTALRENLSSAGISYRHEPALGSPSAVRNELRRSGDYETFFEAYDRHLAVQNKLLTELTKLSGRIALLCYERCPKECHRLSVAKELSKRTGLGVKHLGVNADRGRSNRTIESSHTRQGISAA